MTLKDLVLERLQRRLPEEITTVLDRLLDSVTEEAADILYKELLEEKKVSLQSEKCLTEVSVTSLGEKITSIDSLIKTTEVAAPK